MLIHYSPSLPPAHCSLTKIAAMPIPEPIHMLVQKILPPVCFAMFKPVATCLAPASVKETCQLPYHEPTPGEKDVLHPRGWPMAMAPPFTLTFSKGMPRCCTE